MAQRVIQLPKGFDVVPWLMPLAVLLGLGVVQVRFRLIAPAMVAVLTGVVVCETAAFPLTAFRVLDLAAAVLMSGVVLRFAYRLELAGREGWIRARRLGELARRDTLTGMPNRRAFTDDLSAVPADGLVRSLMLIDVDGLKEFNDTHGHPAGDTYIAGIADAITVALGLDDTAYRIGGDEFAVMLVGPDSRTVTARAEHIVDRVGDLRVRIDSGVHPVSVSAGLATIGDDDDAVTVRADHALYLAKCQGGGRVIAVD